MRENPDDGVNGERGHDFHAGKVERLSAGQRGRRVEPKTSKRRSRADTKFKYSTEIPHAS